MLTVGFLTDVGNKKKINQDSLIVKKGLNENGEILLIAVCDGMGGLSDGEYASAVAVDYLNEWFNYELSDLLKNGISDDSFVKSIKKVIFKINKKILKYSKEKEIQCGTTISGVLLYNGRYATFNVGDSRVYKVTNEKIEQLTHDQSLVQKLIDQGEITVKEAKRHKQRNVLLQCLGVSEKVYPDYTFGEYFTTDVFFVCSDGFVHTLTDEELFTLFSPTSVEIERINEKLDYVFYVVKGRGENDNITLICCQV